MTETRDLDVIQHGGIHRINSVTSREHDLQECKRKLTI